jgi:hypothetical protein
MPFDETDDLAAMFDTADFAVSATYNGASVYPVIFDRAYLEQLGIAGTTPVALGLATDFTSSAVVGKTLLIGSTTWTIRGYEPQADGATVLLTLKA